MSSEVSIVLIAIKKPPACWQEVKQRKSQIFVQLPLPASLDWFKGAPIPKWCYLILGDYNTSQGVYTSIFAIGEKILFQVSKMTERPQNAIIGA